jgi:hypothetical protein
MGINPDLYSTKYRWLTGIMAVFLQVISNDLRQLIKEIVQVYESHDKNALKELGFPVSLRAFFALARLGCRLH